MGKKRMLFMAIMLFFPFEEELEVLYCLTGMVVV